MNPERDFYEITDYWYEVSDQQILDHLARSPIDRLRWLDEARRFALLAREGKVEEASGIHKESG
jgi:hypothetical protein